MDIVKKVLITGKWKELAPVQVMRSSASDLRRIHFYLML